MEREGCKTGFVELLAGEKPNREKRKMKKTILIALLLVGAGLATSKAGVAFGINVDNGRGVVGGTYVSDGCGQPYNGNGFVYNGQYRYNDGYGYGYGRAYSPSTGSAYGYYGQHQALHHDLWHEHQDLHGDLRAQHNAEHRELQHEAAHGVPWWELERQHDAMHRELRHEHQDSHGAIRQDHRDGHYELGW